MALDRFYNEDEILSKQPVGQVFDNQDRGLQNESRPSR